MESKNALQSKTIWFNILSVVGIILTDLLATTEFRELLNNNVIWIMIAGAIANFLLRFGSDKPVKIKPEKKPVNPLEQALRDEAEENGIV